MLQLPRVGWRLLACENGASPDCIIVVVVSDTGEVSRMCLSTNAVLIGMALNSGTTRRSAKNAEKTRKAPSSPPKPADPLQLRTGLSANSSDDLNQRHIQCSKTHRRCMITGTTITARGTSKHLITGVSATLAATVENHSFCTSGPQQCLRATGMKTALSRNCTPMPCLTTTGMSPPVRKLQLWNFHSFLLNQTPSTCRCITTKVNDLVQKAEPPDERHVFLHDLWHDATICCLNQEGLPAIIGNAAEVHEDQQNQENACHCHNRRRARPLPADKRREHSTKCINTSKTSRMHTTAVVEDERGHFLPANVGNTARSAPRPVKPVECMPLPLWKTRAATSCRQTSGTQHEVHQDQ